MKGKVLSAAELEWAIKDLERKLKASNDFVIFLVASIACADPNLSKRLIDQFTEMKEAKDLTQSRDFQNLLERAISASGDGDLELDSVE